MHNGRDEIDGHRPADVNAITPATRQPFRTTSLPLGKCLIDNFDSFAEVLALVEGEDFR